MGLVWLKFGPEVAAGIVPGASPASQSSKQNHPQIPKPEFTFHSILPEIEVVIPDDEILPERGSTPTPPPASAPQKPESKPATAISTTTPASTTAATPPATAKSATTQTRGEPKANYILQMGSFGKFADADRLKARLALLGIQSQIQRVSINDKEIYHRVRSGPYSNEAEVNRLRKLAKDNQINAILLKLKD